MATTNPFEEMHRLFDEMDRRFDEMRRSMWGGAGDEGSAALAPVEGSGRGSWMPAPLRRFDVRGGSVRLDFDEEASEYVAIADLPGFETEEIDLAVADGFLTIVAVHEVADADRARSRRFEERVSLPRSVDETAATATYRNGVLEVHLPVSEAENGHHIEIEE